MSVAPRQVDRHQNSNSPPPESLPCYNFETVTEKFCFFILLSYDCVVGNLSPSIFSSLIFYGALKIHQVLALIIIVRGGYLAAEVTSYRRFGETVIRHV